jgi:hypothetical protein
MPRLDIHCDGDNCWPDLRDDPGLIILMGKNAPPIGLALLPHGMVSGRASVMFRITLPDGRTVITETSLALLDQALAIFHASLAGRAERG